MIYNKHSRLVRLLKVIGIVFCLWLGLAILYVLSGRVDDHSDRGFLALGLMAVTVTLIWYDLLQSEGGIGLELTRPLSLYGIFYFLYYILPYLLLFYEDLIPSHNEVLIAVLLLVGYTAFRAGIRISSAQKLDPIQSSWIEKQDARILLGLCVTAICMVGYVYLWRDAEGIFYNQARFYEQDPTVSAALRDVFGMSLQLPILLMLGLLSSVRHKRVALICRWSLVIYALCVFFLMVLSSQTRLAVTGLLFTVMAIKLYRTFVVRPWHLLILATISIGAMLLIQGVRVSDIENLRSADGQFKYALENTFQQGYAGVNESSDVISRNIKFRSGANILFLSQIIDSPESGSLYGQGVLEIAPSVVPRVFWRDKPNIGAPQLEYEKLLGLELKDAPLTPINQFYAEGGFLAVMIGYLVFGWLMGKLSVLVSHIPRLIVLIPAFFIWSIVVQIENELIVGTLAMLRNALLIFLTYLIARTALNIIQPVQKSRRRFRITLPAATDRQ